MISDDRIVERLSLVFSDYTEESVLDAVLVFFAQLGVDDPAQLAPKLRARLALIASSLASLDVDRRLLEAIAEVFGEEKARALGVARSLICAAPIARKEAPKPLDQRTSVVAIRVARRVS